MSKNDLHDDEPEYGGRGCLCTYRGRGGNDPDAYCRRERDCPIHGEDPDAALERKRDDRSER